MGGNVTPLEGMCLGLSGRKKFCACVIVTHSPPPWLAADNHFPAACDDGEENCCDL
jgi:hypothetical protein